MDKYALLTGCGCVLLLFMLLEYVGPLRKNMEKMYTADSLALYLRIGPIGDLLMAAGMLIEGIARPESGVLLYLGWGMAIIGVVIVLTTRSMLIRK